MLSEEIVNLPVTGAVFTFGKSRYADNTPSHFFIKNDLIIDVACGDEHTAVACQSGRVFTFGNNESGQLGLGHRQATLKPSCIKSLKPTKCTNVSCGRSHTLIRTDGGQVYACGNNTEGQLGLGSLPQDQELPVFVEGIHSVLHLSAGSFHSLALTESGSVYVWGSNTYGQLGLGDESTVSVPTLLKLDKVVIRASCGYYHTLLLTSEAKIYVFGEGEFGKLGLGDEKSVYFPKQIPLDSEIVHISAGGNHSSAITREGKLLMWGNNDKSQLGMENVEKIYYPHNVFAFETDVITTVSCGDNHTSLITADGSLFSFGDNKHGKLGLDYPDEATTPMKIDKLCNLNVKVVKCGGCHTMVLAFPMKHSDQVLNGIVRKYSTSQFIDSTTSSSLVSSTSRTSIPSILKPSSASPYQFLPESHQVETILQPSSSPTSRFTPQMNYTTQKNVDLVPYPNEKPTLIIPTTPKSLDTLSLIDERQKEEKIGKFEKTPLRRTSSLLQGVNAVSVIKPFKSEEYYTGNNSSFSDEDSDCIHPQSNKIIGFSDRHRKLRRHQSIEKCKSETIDCSNLQYHICTQLKELDKTVNALRENVDVFTNQFCHGTRSLQNTLQKVKSSFKCNKKSSVTLPDNSYNPIDEDHQYQNKKKSTSYPISEWLLGSSSGNSVGSIIVNSDSSCTYCKMCWRRIKKSRKGSMSNRKDSNQNLVENIENDKNIPEPQTNGLKSSKSVECLIEEYHQSKEYGGAGDAPDFNFKMDKSHGLTSEVPRQPLPHQPKDTCEDEEECEETLREEVKESRLSKLFFLRKKSSLSVKSSQASRENVRSNCNVMTGDAKRSKACTII